MCIWVYIDTESELYIHQLVDRSDLSWYVKAGTSKLVKLVLILVIEPKYNVQKVNIPEYLINK